MKYIVAVIFFLTLSFSQNTYGYGDIDMHGGKKDSLTDNKDKSMSGFSNQNMSNFLGKKEPKKIKHEKKEKGLNKK